MGRQASTGHALLSGGDDLGGEARVFAGRIRPDQRL
jgi:hypothetical protein